MKSTTLLLWLPAILTCASGCSGQLARVKPFERGNLARAVMASSLDPLQMAMTEHAYFSREAASGGGGVGGGGCGCN